MTSLVKEEIIGFYLKGLNFNKYFERQAFGMVLDKHALPPIEGVLEKKGLAPSFSERVDLTEKGLHISPLEDEQLQPAGLDFTVGTEIYSSDMLFRINSLKDLEKLRKFKLGEGKKFVLEPDDLGRRVYYILSKEEIKLPDNLELVVDAKSTTGRLGCMCQNVSNNNLIRGKQGKIVAAVRPYAFPIKITADKSRLLQGIIRYRKKDEKTLKYASTPFMSHEEIRKSEEIIFSRNNKKIDLNDLITADGLKLSFSTNKIYAARPLADIPEAIDIDKKNFYNAEDYFEEISGEKEIIMQPRRLYLFGTQETVSLGSVCGRLTREHAELLSGLWSHFAGFFWPGYSGEITLECWSDTKRLIRDGELAGVVALDELSRDYKKKDKKFVGYKGSYQNQKAPRLPKMFKVES